MDEGILTLSGERKSESTTEKGQIKRVERNFGTFQRRFRLPVTARQNEIKAVLNHGVLEVLTQPPFSPSPTSSIPPSHLPTQRHLMGAARPAQRWLCCGSVSSETPFLVRGR